MISPVLLAAFYVVTYLLCFTLFLKPDNYCGISQTCVIAKMYNRMILNRIQSGIDPHLKKKTKWILREENYLSPDPSLTEDHSRGEEEQPNSRVVLHRL